MAENSWYVARVQPSGGVAETIVWKFHVAYGNKREKRLTKAQEKAKAIIAAKAIKDYCDSLANPELTPQQLADEALARVRWRDTFRLSDQFKIAELLIPQLHAFDYRLTPIQQPPKLTKDSQWEANSEGTNLDVIWVSKSKSQEYCSPYYLTELMLGDNPMSEWAVDKNNFDLNLLAGDPDLTMDFVSTIPMAVNSIMKIVMTFDPALDGWAILDNFKIGLQLFPADATVAQLALTQPVIPQ